MHGMSFRLFFSKKMWTPAVVILKLHLHSKIQPKTCRRVDHIAASFLKRNIVSLEPVTKSIKEPMTEQGRRDSSVRNRARRVALSLFLSKFPCLSKFSLSHTDTH